MEFVDTEYRNIEYLQNNENPPHCVFLSLWAEFATDPIDTQQLC